MGMRETLLTMFGLLSFANAAMAQPAPVDDGIVHLGDTERSHPAIPVVSRPTGIQQLSFSSGSSGDHWVEALGTRVEPAQPLWSSPTRGITIDGWMDQGFTINPDDPRNRFNGPVTFNDRANEYQLNQLYLLIEKQADWNGADLDWGGRVDFLVGSDYFFTTSVGLETHSNGTPKWNGDGPRTLNSARASLYGLALPQAYASLYAPLGNGIEFKLGHFYAGNGLESVQAPNNFFYSHSYAFQYGQPRTLTGIQADYRLDPNTMVTGVLHKGWDASQATNDPWGLVGNIRWTSTDTWTVVSWSFLYGDESGVAGNDTRTLSNLVITYQIDESTRFALEQNYGVQQDGEVGTRGLNDSAKWYGFAAYLMVDLTPDWSAGLRVEWFRDQDNARVAQFPIDEFADGGNYYAITLGANYSPWSNLVIRPEIRIDWSDFALAPPFNAVSGAFDDGADNSQLTLGIDVIYRF